MDVQKRVGLAAKIFEEHGATIRAFISLQVNGTFDADDIYQTLFLSLVRRPIPSHIQNVSGYLYRAIQNDATDMVRRKQIYKDHISRYAKDPQHKNVQKDVQSMVIEAEDIQKMVQSIKRCLCHHEALAILERFGCNHNGHDIATTKCIKKRTLSRYICTGLKKLRQNIGEGANVMDAPLTSLSSITSTNRVRSLNESKGFFRQPKYV
jgi:RNA polymerase sigma factor (sigma-70 family)